MSTLSYSEIGKLLAKKDPVMAKLIESVKTELKPSPGIDVYYALLESIVSQQLSIKVADIIWQRFVQLFENQYPDAKQILRTDDQVFRNIGLSGQKTKYINNVARFSLENNLSFDYINSKSDDEIIEFLTQIVGIGKWTVQMILMFPMDRPDVFPVDDLGIQTKMKIWYKLDGDKKELKNKLTNIAEKWKPYRTVACKYLWKSIPNIKE